MQLSAVRVTTLVLCGVVSNYSSVWTQPKQAEQSRAYR